MLGGVADAHILILPANSDAAETATLTALTALCTNAVVAMLVELSLKVCVGAVGVPVNAGLTFCSCTKFVVAS